MSLPDNRNPTLQAVKSPFRMHRSCRLDAFAPMHQVSDAVPEDDTAPLDAHDIFNLIRHISDPEHPFSLEQLSVVSEPQISVNNGDEVTQPSITIEFTPTIPHCSMVTIIGLCIRVRLLRVVPAKYKVDLVVKDGTHVSRNAVNRQLNDKERVAAALENQHLLSLVDNCLSTADKLDVV